MANIVFKIGQKEEFEKLQLKDPHTLYWIYDALELWKGDELYGVGRAATNELAGLLTPEYKAKLDRLIAAGTQNLKSEDASIVIIDGKISVGISKSGNNAIKLNDDGLFVDLSDLESLVASLNIENASTGQIPVMSSSGAVVWSDIALRRDNDYNYKKIESTFIPQNGEVCFVDVAGYGLKTKVGDGKSTFAQLNYLDESIFKTIDSLIVKGYYHQGKFYSDSARTTPLEDVVGRIYIDAVSSKIYTYDGVAYGTFSGNVQNATSTTAGIMKLYDQVGHNTDGTMTQNAITNELNDKFEMDVVEEEEMIVFDNDIN